MKGVVSMLGLPGKCVLSLLRPMTLLLPSEQRLRA